MGPAYGDSHRALLRARGLLRRTRAALAKLAGVHDQIRAAHAELVASGAEAQLAALDLGALREVTSATHLHLAPLRAVGINTVGQLLAHSDKQLLALPGLGSSRVRALRTAATTLQRAATVAQVFRLDPDQRTRSSDRLVAGLAEALAVRDAGRRLTDWEQDAGQQLERLLHVARPAANRLRWTFAGEAGRQRAARVADLIIDVLDASTEAAALTTEVLQGAGTRVPVGAAWQQFTTRAGDFYAELERLTGTLGPRDGLRGGLAAEIVERVERQELDVTLLKGTLRTYQHFGARFILAQQKVIVGDEMGLGKTFQAIAAMSHLAAGGQRHFLVVCPASVLVGWARELAMRSQLAPHRLHGDDRDAALADWVRDGGVGITTYETLRMLTIPQQLVAMVVVDEAHYIKNPDAKRTRTAAALLASCPRAVLLTGTPLENRVEEFTALVGLLRPQLVDGLDLAAMRLGSDAFRREVAPVYLRRNQSDVLMELPAMVQTDEWVKLGAIEQRAYLDAVAVGNWMAMRQAGFAGGAASEKMERLVDLCEEAAANGRKVIVFSYFLDTLEQVSAALGGRAVGPLTGSASPDRRQELVDDFSSGPPDLVLVSQVQAGGVGLNVQAASVVVLCEPQLKPSTEQQAIARVHRMGQARHVDVHRLCAEDTIDERIIELLAGKQRVFDEFAARSVVAEASGAAKDPGISAVASRLIAVEQARLGADASG